MHDILFHLVPQAHALLTQIENDLLPHLMQLRWCPKC